MVQGYVEYLREKDEADRKLKEEELKLKQERLELEKKREEQRMQRENLMMNLLVKMAEKFSYIILLFITEWMLRIIVVLQTKSA